MQQAGEISLRRNAEFKNFIFPISRKRVQIIVLKVFRKICKIARLKNCRILQSGCLSDSERSYSPYHLPPHLPRTLVS